jgi:hypothetical protein
MLKRSGLYKMQVQDDANNPDSWHDVTGPDGRPLTFDKEADARAELASRFPVQVQMEKYTGPKTTRVIAILEDEED